MKQLSNPFKTYFQKGALAIITISSIVMISLNLSAQLTPPAKYTRYTFKVDQVIKTKLALRFVGTLESDPSKTIIIDSTFYTPSWTIDGATKATDETFVDGQVEASLPQEQKKGWIIDIFNDVNKPSINIIQNDIYVQGGYIGRLIY